MRVELTYGRTPLELQVEDRNVIPLHRQPPVPPLANLSAAVRSALEAPLRYPPLRRALTPDDLVTIVVDEQLPQVSAFLLPILEHVCSAGVDPEAITLLCTPPSTGQAWLEDLPEEFESVRVEVHDPHERKRISYLATTRQDRRVYLNRSAIDADQLVVLTRRCYDPLLGYGGAEGALFPVLSDAATRAEMGERLSLAAPGEKPWRTRQEATEVSWLVGASTFFVQAVAGPGETMAHVIGGLVETCNEGQRLLDARWRVEAEAEADNVVLGVGRAGRVRFEALAAALGCGARVVKPGGRIVLLCDGELELMQDVELLRRAESPEGALRLLHREKGTHPAAFLWASAASKARIYLLGKLPEEAAEELFAVPLEHAGQVQKLVGEGTSLVLSDAEKTLAVVRGA